jgi:2-aminoethylphosphonate-pyruvate transaminase
MTGSYSRTMDEEPKLGYEFQILRTAKSCCPMHVLNMPRLQWYEIDDTSDLAYAEKNIALT